MFCRYFPLFLAKVDKQTSIRFILSVQLEENNMLSTSLCTMNDWNSPKLTFVWGEISVSPDHLQFKKIDPVCNGLIFVFLTQDKFI